MGKNIKGDVSDLISELQAYNNAVVGDMEKLGEKLAKKTREKLKETSPKKSGGGKHYADGWAVTHIKEAGGAKQRTIVYNKLKPTLVHLLENGHLIGDTGKRTRPIKHVEPAQNQINEEWEKGVEEILENN